MHSSSAACVFGEARLISSTSRMFAKTGPGRNSNSFARWLKTLTPVTSVGSRSGVNCSREKRQSTERASAFASIVFPTPGKSSMIRCPSETRQSTHRRSVSAGACTTLARLPAMRSIVSADPAARRPGLPAASIRLHQPRELVEDSGGDICLVATGNRPLPVGADQDDLVVGHVEADVSAGHVVVDDEVGPLVAELLACARDPGLTV